VQIYQALYRDGTKLISTEIVRRTKIVTNRSYFFA